MEKMGGGRAVSFETPEIVRGDPGAFRAQQAAFVAVRRELDQPMRTVDDLYMRARGIAAHLTNFASRHPENLTAEGIQFYITALTAMRAYIDLKRERHLDLARRYTTTGTYPREHFNRVERLFSQVSHQLGSAIGSLERAASGERGRATHLDSALSDVNNAFSTLRELEPAFSRSVGYLERAIDRRQLVTLMLKIGTAAGTSIASIAAFGITGSMLVGGAVGGGFEAAGGSPPDRVVMSALFGGAGNAVPAMRVADVFRKSVDAWNDGNRAAVRDGTALDIPPFAMSSRAMRENLELIWARQRARLSEIPERLE
jgi:hypothetical protein